MLNTGLLEVLVSVAKNRNVEYSIDRHECVSLYLDKIAYTIKGTYSGDARKLVGGIGISDDPDMFTIELIVPDEAPYVHGYYGWHVRRDDFVNMPINPMAQQIYSAVFMMKQYTTLGISCRGRSAIVQLSDGTIDTILNQSRGYVIDSMFCVLGSQLAEALPWHVVESQVKDILSKCRSCKRVWLDIVPDNRGSVQINVTTDDLSECASRHNDPFSL